MFHRLGGPLPQIDAVPLTRNYIADREGSLAQAESNRLEKRVAAG
jgi:hypothetical protein